MKSNNKIYSFFILLALLFWNPISYYIFYGRSPIIPGKINFGFYALFALICIVGLILINRIQKDKVSERTKKIIFSLAFAGILFAGLVTADRFLGLVSNKEVASSEVEKGLIFEPNSTARYQTIEFNVEANINSIGLRNDEIDIDKGDAFRILCFGDSWTFGWGVEEEDSWPRKLETYLHENGYRNVEVINCGEPGQFTSVYKKHVANAVPLLKPDLVLVGALQLDDLAQLYESGFQANAPKKKLSKKAKVKLMGKAFLGASFKNIIAQKSKNATRDIDIRANWIATANAYVDKLNYLQQIRFSTLPDTLQSLIKTGDINPSLLPAFFNLPDRTLVFNDPTNHATQFAVEAMKEDLKEIKAICQDNNSSLIFVNLPIADFTGHKTIRPEVYKIMNKYLEQNNHIDSLYHSVALANQVQYMELTDLFMELEDKSKYFFQIDGHPNELGQLEIGNYIGAQLIENEQLTNN